MTLQLEHWNESEEGKLTEVALRTRLENKGYSVTRYIYPPGTYFAEHTHAVDKIDAVLSGRFKMTMAGQSVVLQAGDSLEVPKGIIHSAEVIGDEPVISLDAVRG